MAEPMTSTTAGAGAMALTLSGSVLGIQYDALTLALLGGLVALMWLQPMSHFRKFACVATSALFGGVSAPIGAAAALNFFEWMQAVPSITVRMAAAFALGLCAQTLLPALLSLAARKGEQA